MAKRINQHTCMIIQQTIQTILQYMYEHRTELANHKAYGLHKIEDYYRVHMYSFIPRVLNIQTMETSAAIDTVVKTHFSDIMDWNSHDLWLTIYDTE